MDIWGSELQRLWFPFTVEFLCGKRWQLLLCKIAAALLTLDCIHLPHIKTWQSLFVNITLWYLVVRYIYLLVRYTVWYLSKFNNYLNWHKLICMYTVIPVVLHALKIMKKPQYSDERVPGHMIMSPVDMVQFWRIYLVQRDCNFGGSLFDLANSGYWSYFYCLYWDIYI